MRRAVLVLLVPLGACATKRDLLDLQSEVRALSARQDSAFAALQRSVDEGNRAAMDSVHLLSELIFNFRGDANGSLREIQRQQDDLRELLGQNQHMLDLLGDEMDVQWQQLERRIASRVSEEGDSLGGGEVVVPDPAEPPGTAVDEQALFDVAVTNLRRDLRTSALRGFTTFLEQYPRSPLAPAAYLHRGELLTLEGQREEAIADYLEVPRMFPTSDQIPAALYRAGVLCIELEDYDRAREYLERVINTYPDGGFAEQAREKLEEIP